MHLSANEAHLYEGHRGLSFNGHYVVGAVALLDIASMLLFFTLSYIQAQISSMDNDLVRIWKVTDATFCVSILYLMMASGGYRESTLSNPYSQVSRILVNAMLVTPSGVYAGSMENGLLVYNRATGRWTRTAVGLPSLNVTALAAEGGTIYVGTDNGLVRIAENNLR